MHLCICTYAYAPMHMHLCICTWSDLATPASHAATVLTDLTLRVPPRKDELRVYWFEIAECARKIALIGIPVFFTPGSMPQLILGLMICFLSFGGYMMLSPFVKDKHDYVAQICQVQIFFALLSSVVLNSNPTPAEKQLMGVILISLQAVPPLATAFLSSPLSKHVLEKDKRNKLIKILGKVHNKVMPKLQLLWAKLRGVGKFSQTGSKYVTCGANP